MDEPKDKIRRREKKNPRQLLENRKKRDYQEADLTRKPSRIEHLKCYDDVVACIREGWQVPAIAHRIQNVHQEMLDVKESSVVRCLYRFVKNLPVGEVVEERIPTLYMHMVDTIDQQLDGLQALSNLFYIQYDRMMIDYRTEAKVGKLFDGNTNNVKLCAEIAYRVEELKMKMLGASMKARPVLTNTLSPEESQKRMDEMRAKVSEKYGDRLGAIAADPARRRKLLGVFEKITNLGDQRFVNILDKIKEHDKIVDAEIIDKDVKEQGNGSENTEVRVDMESVE